MKGERGEEMEDGVRISRRSWQQVREATSLALLWVNLIGWIFGSLCLYFSPAVVVYSVRFTIFGLQ